MLGARAESDLAAQGSGDAQPGKESWAPGKECRGWPGEASNKIS